MMGNMALHSGNVAVNYDYITMHQKDQQRALENTQIHISVSIRAETGISLSIVHIPKQYLIIMYTNRFYKFSLWSITIQPLSISCYFYAQRAKPTRSNLIVFT